MSYVKNVNPGDIKQLGLSDLTRIEREAIAQKGVERAIQRMHSSGIATVEARSDGTTRLRYPNGTCIPISKGHSIGTVPQE